MLNRILSIFKVRKTTDYIILGASAAGINAAKTLRKLDRNCSIIIISKDEKIYSRCMLHHVISNHKTVKDINFVDEKFILDNNIKWITGKTVKHLNVDEKLVELEDETIKYDKLLISTGASACIPDIKNLKDANFVYSLRNIEDVYKIKEKAKESKKVAIIGAGLVGLDALVGLMEYKNLELNLINTSEFILNKQLDEYSAQIYEKKFIENKVRLHQNVAIKEIVLKSNKDVKKILLKDGSSIECDMIIVATGVKPNVEFIDKTKIQFDKGIVINDKCETSQKDVYAAGDVLGTNFIWPLAVKQGIVAAYNMLGREKEINDMFTLKNSINFMGIPTVSVGIINTKDDIYKVVTRFDNNNYRKFIYKDNIIYGMIAQGDISYTGTFAYLIKNKVKIQNLENRIFDIGYSDFLTLKENGEFCYNI